ncbi:MAG: flippase-like domain-containing protein [Rhodospirillales bacterium]|nr:flippase-like domain-containing protein [Rhodospirillales bacterium]
MKYRRWLGAVFKVAISLVLIVVLFNAIGVEDAVARLSQVNSVWLSLALVVALFQIVLCSERWRGVLAAVDARLSAKDAWIFWYIGAFFSQTLPSSVGGDAVRGYLAFKHGLSFAQVLSSLVLERVATVLALVVLVAVLTPFVVADLQGGEWFQRAVWLALAAALGGTAVMMALDRLPASLTRFRVVRGLVVLAGDARRALLHPVRATRAMGWSFLGHVNLSLVVYLLARALNIELSLLLCLVLFPPSLLAQIVPISLAGWGVREGALVALFALAGVAADEALALSILYGLVMAVISLPGVVLWLAAKRRTLKDAEAFAAKVDAA